MNKIKQYLSILIVVSVVNINGGNIMSLREKVLEIVTLNDDEYFEIEQEDIFKLDDKLTDLDRFDTIVITAPGNIDISKRNHFPVLYTSQDDALREWTVPENRNLITVIYNKTSDILKAGTPRKDKKRRPKGYWASLDHPEEMPETVSRTAYSTGCQMYYLNKSLNIPMKPSDYSITFICYDWISNTINVKLIDGKNELPNGIPLPDPKLPFVESIISPTKQSSSVFEFKLPKEGGILPKDISVKGKFKLTITEYNILKQKNNTDIDAVIPVYFMMVYKNLDQRSPLVFRWNILIKEDGEINNGDNVEGIFKFKLNELFGSFGDDPLKPREYLCYMIVNGTVFGYEKLLIVK